MDEIRELYFIWQLRSKVDRMVRYFRSVDGWMDGWMDGWISWSNVLGLTLQLTLTYSIRTNAILILILMYSNAIQIYPLLSRCRCESLFTACGANFGFGLEGFGHVRYVFV